MDQKAYDTLISRLEQTAEENPKKYLASVIAVALLGFVIFGIALGFSLIAAALLVGLVLLAIFSGGKSLLLLGKAGKLVYVLALPAWTMVKSSMTMMFSRFPRPDGRALSSQEAPALFKRLDELRNRMAGPRIYKVLLRDELNAAIVQHPRFGLFGWEQNYLILGLPLLQSLSEEEALAVIAHEYGHLSGHHSRLGGFIYRFRAAWGRVQNLAEQWDDWGSRIMARLLRWYAPYFNAYTFVLARQNEYVADRTSMELVGRRNAALALKRINVMAQFEEDVFWPSINRLVTKEPEPPASRFSFWNSSLKTQLDEDTCTRLLQTAYQRRTDNLDTHPALSDRLAGLGVAVKEDAEEVLLPPDVTAAEAWLGDRRHAIQDEFDAAWRDAVSENWQARHDYLQDRRKRLEELDAQPSLEAGGQWERLCIIEEVQPDFDLLPLLNVFLDKDAEHTGARFRRGALLLSRGEEAGIADLEFVMEKDNDAMLTGYELAWRFYLSRDAERAQHYLDKLQHRSEFVQKVQAELEKLPPDATLTAAELDTADLEAIRDILRRNDTHIRRAYVLRRVLTTDPSIKDYVLAFETGILTIGDKGPTVIEQLAKEDFPFRMFIVHLGTSPYKRFRKSIKRLGIEPLTW